MRSDITHVRQRGPARNLKIGTVRAPFKRA